MINNSHRIITLIFLVMYLCLRLYEGRWQGTHLKRFGLQSMLRSTLTNCNGIVNKQNDVKINTTYEEELLFNMFRNVILDESPSTTVRVAGGWVRDKLLGSSSKNDIDIALDNKSGIEFAAALNRWCENNLKKNFRVGVIQQNPEKSKHLETATAHIGPYSIDFVNLRTETYTNDSRIPLMEFGTPLEDALRRDLTINALFYNVNTKMIEDFTEKGIEDLRNGIIRTPLPALITLLDDPLRALRAIRFACRFQFSIHSELFQSASETSVQSALATKVSRERISDEVMQMLLKNSCLRAIVLLYKVGYFPFLFPLPTSSPSSISSSKTNLNLDMLYKYSDKAEKLSPNKDKDTPIGSTVEIFRGVFHEFSFISMMLSIGILDLFEMNHTSKYKDSTLLLSLIRDPADKDDWGNHRSNQITLSRDLPRLSEFAVSIQSLLTELPNLRKILCLGAICVQSVGYRCSDPKKPKRNMQLSDYILQRNLCLSNRDSDDITAIYETIQKLRPLLNTVELFLSTSEPSPVEVTTTTTQVSMHPNTAVAASIIAGPGDEDKDDTRNKGLSPARYGPLDRLSLGLVFTSSGILSPLALWLAVIDRILTTIRTKAVDGAYSAATVVAVLLDILDMNQPEIGSKSLLFSAHSHLSMKLAPENATTSITTSSIPNQNDGHNASHGEMMQDLRDTISKNCRVLEFVLEASKQLDIKLNPNHGLNTTDAKAFEQAYASHANFSSKFILKSNPLLDGHAVLQLLPNIPKGREIQNVMTSQLKWRLSYPNKDAESLRTYLRELYKDYV